MKKGLIGGVFLAVIIIIGLVILGLSAKRVPAGYVGVVYSMNQGVAENTLEAKWHLVGPTKHVTLYSIGIEQSYLTSAKEGDSPGDDSFSAPSSDGKGLQMELTFTYRYDAEQVSQIFTKFKGRSGKDLLTTFIKPNVISWTKEVTAKYPVTDILGEKRAELNTILSNYLADKFAPYGIIIENASLINIEVDDETRKAITKKVNAQQELELAKTQAETAKINAEKEKEVALIEAEQKKETAKIQAEQAKIEAEGKAKAKKIAADAEAEANRKIAKSLTKELIEKIKYEQWNGQLPQVQGSNTPIVDMNK